MKNLKAVSPVIATIIIVAIAIVMAIAVAYWMLGLGGAFTRYEKLEIPTAYAVYETNKNFTITMIVKNTGSATATIDKSALLFNGKPANAYGGFEPSINVENPTLEPGSSTKITIELKHQDDPDSPWQHGMTVEIMIHTVAGKDYPKVIVLP
ncbi:MAG: archaellin/type IV pilin N-terminal domain-containing protein [Candidatus Bathyarchaeia archaeon]